VIGAMAKSVITNTLASATRTISANQNTFANGATKAAGKEIKKN